MRSTSFIAGIVAIGLLVGTATVAQQVTVETSAQVSAEVSTQPITSTVSSAVSSALSQASSALSSASSQVSSALSQTSSDLSSALDTSSAMDTSSSSSMMAEPTCADVGTLMSGGASLDTAALAAVTSVTVFLVDDCSNLPENMDASSLAEIGTNQLVINALASSGQAGAEIIAYSLEGTSLTVYVRSGS